MVDYRFSPLAQCLAKGGPVDPLDVQPLTQRLHEPDEDILSYIIGQNAMRAQGQIPPLDWGGDLSGVHLPAQRRRYADGGEVDDGYGDDQEPPISDDLLKQMLAYLYAQQQMAQPED